MKKKKLKNLKLNKSKIANLNTMQSISGGSNVCESRVICPGDDTVDCDGGGGGGGGTGVGCESIINCFITQLCGPTQQTCGCP